MIQIHLLRYKNHRGIILKCWHKHILSNDIIPRKKGDQQKTPQDCWIKTSNYKKHIQLDISKIFNPWSPVNNICHQLRSTLPQGFFLCEKTMPCVFFVAFYVFLWFFLAWLKIQNSQSSVPPKEFPRRTPRLKVLRTQLTCCLRCFSHPVQPSCKCSPQGFIQKNGFGLDVLDIQKPYCITWCYPQKRKETWGFCAKPAKKTPRLKNLLNNSVVTGWIRIKCQGQSTPSIGDRPIPPFMTQNPCKWVYYKPLLHNWLHDVIPR